MKRIFSSLEKSYLKKIDGKGLAIFRIVFSLVFLGEVLQLNYFRHLIFDEIPYIETFEISMWPAFLFWIIAIIFVIFGLFTRVAAIINYILTVIVLGTITSFEYHMFYTYLIVNFLFIFLPISRNFSLDRLRLKLKYSNTKFRYNPPTDVSAVNYFILTGMSIGFVYFDSVFFKLSSNIWLQGYGIWLPASIPQAIYLNLTPLLNIKYLTIFLSWLTLAFEAIFIFIFFFKSFRTPLIIIGVGLHLGILIAFPIPFFALGVISIYILLVPVGMWEKLFSKKNIKKAYVKFYYDAECPLCNRTRIVLNHLDVNNKILFLTVQANAEDEGALDGIDEQSLLNDIYSVDHKNKVYRGIDTYIRVFKAIWFFKPLSWFLSVPGIYHIGKKVYGYVALNRNTERCTEESCGYELPVLPPREEEMKILTNFTLQDLKIRILFIGLLILVLMQVIVTYNSPLLKNAKNFSGISNFKIINTIDFYARELHRDISKPFFGITHHGVFVDSHFENYNHAIGVVYINNEKEVWLPITNNDGSPGPYMYGEIWAKWTFRSNAPEIDQEVLAASVRDFTAFWAHKNNVDLNDAVFKIKVKKTDVPKSWEKDFLNKQLNHPWLDGGEVYWKNKKFESDIVQIESL
ncbi:DCC1-like thiol-disulfide oxidoreductase family protein [Leeuwenhoekiella sp. LLG6367-2.1]|uniref:DCC1-like thiol-disulfide oxidoreductase family protein n=1 Tax=Leeuwenhoekiella sp. LLG6367-2.1 TaxID=3160833 RepID=UPI00386D8A82